MTRLISLWTFVGWGMCCLHREWVQQRDDLIAFRFLLFSWSSAHYKWYVIDSPFKLIALLQRIWCGFQYLLVPSSFESPCFQFWNSVVTHTPLLPGSLTFCILYKTHLDSFHRTLAVEKKFSHFLLCIHRVVLDLEHCLLGELGHRLSLLVPLAVTTDCWRDFEELGQN